MTEPSSIGTIEPATQVTGIRFSPCSRVLLAPGFDGQVRRWLWRGEDGAFSPVELSPVTGHRGFATAAECHPARLVAFSADSWGQIRAWPYLATSPEPLWTLDAAHDGWIRSLAVGGEGDWVVTAGRDGVVRLHSSTDGGRLAEYRGAGVEEWFAVAAHPSGQWIVAADLHGRIFQWEVASGKVVREFDGKTFHLLDRLQDIGGLRQLAFDREGRTLLAAGCVPGGGGNVRGHARVRLFDFASGSIRHDLPMGEADKDIFAHQVALLDDGSLLVVTTGQPGQGKLLLVMPGEEKPRYETSKGTVNCHGLALAPDGRHFAVSATNTGSNGNGRRLDKDGKYPDNRSPIHFFALPA
ncbi:MAG: hypothetical protein JNK37_17815 [Verrucomicrobiales bacterium]|nr:hypothetical protein [Verrucomicrobiales bacterium]